MNLRPKEQHNETRGCFFGKIKKINKFLAKVTKRRKEKIQINKIRDTRGDIKTDPQLNSEVHSGIF
jgi:hypothetical protein